MLVLDCASVLCCSRYLLLFIYVIQLVLECGIGDVLVHAVLWLYCVIVMC